MLIKLEELADIYSGLILSRVATNKKSEKEPLQQYRVIVPKAISSDGLILSDDLANEELRILPDDRRITKVGDIVIKLSTPFDSATITEQFAGCVVPSFCAIIRPKQNICLDYLQAVLISNYCKDQLRAKVVGAVMTILSNNKIKDIKIPLPDFEKQKEIGTRYRETQETIAILNQIVRLEEKRNDIVIKNLVRL